MSAKLYVGSYAKYNNGSIAGAWLELNDYGDSEEFLELVQSSIVMRAIVS